MATDTQDRPGDAPPAASVQVRLLGPIEVVGPDGSPLVLGTRKQRAVLTILALAGGRTVSAEQLVDLLWGDEAPGRAMASLHPYVSNLRRLLEPDRPRRGVARCLVTTAAGYALHVADDAVDSRRFERAASRAATLLADGRAQGSAAQGEEALALWRGDALGEFAGEPFAAVEAARLEELRRAATETWFEARLALGDRSLPTAIEAFVADHPLRERAWELLLRAQYAAGLQADALRAYQRVRAVLMDELGIEPGPRLRQLERAILDHDEAVLRPTPPSPAEHGAPGVTPAPLATAAPHIEPMAPAPPDAGPVAAPAAAAPAPQDGGLAGRDEALARCLEALADVAQRRPRVLLVSGEAGIGKTRLIEELSARAAVDGFDVAYGYCDDDGTAPFAPWNQVLRALGQPPPDLAALGAGALDIDAARHRVIDDIATRLRQESTSRPIVVVVEDLHWADRSSLRCFEFLARHPRTEPLLLVGTCRDEASPELDLTLGALARASGVVRVPLEGLDRAAIGSLADRHAHRSLVPSELALLAERTGGNPFFVIELARLLAAQGADAVAVPASVTDVVRRRLSRLPANAAEVVVVAATIGPSFDLELLEAAAGGDTDELFDVVDVAVVTRIVEPAPDRPGGYRFVHALVRDAILSDLPPLRRARLHARVADVLDRLRPDAPELANHRWEARAIATDAARSACWAAARAADAAFAAGDAARWWERALQLEPDPSPRRGELLLALGRALRGTGQMADSRSRLLEAIDASLATGDVASAARAGIALGSEWSAWIWSGFREVPPEAVQRLEAVLDRLDDADHALRAGVLATLAIGRYNEVDPSPSDDLSARAVAAARRTGDGRTLAPALLNRALALQRPGRDTAQRELLDEVLGLPAVADEQRVTALLLRAANRLRWADRTGAEADLAEVQRRARSAHLASAEIQAQVFQSTLAVIAGDTERAEALAQAIMARAEQRSSGAAAHLGVIAMLGLRRAQDRLAEMEGWLTGIAATIRMAPLDLVGSVLVATGRVDELRALALRPGAAPDPPRDWMWIVDTVLRAEAAVALGDEAMARRQYERLLPLSGSVAVAGIGFVALGLVDTVLGDLAAVAGDRSAAAYHHRTAVQVGHAVGAPHWAAEAQRRLG